MESKKPGTIAYRGILRRSRKAHPFPLCESQGALGDKYNDLADRLAKDALGIQ